MSERALELLQWYDRERRDLPWRMAPGQKADPYKVWLSEIMLQQTTVATVKGYFKKFCERWPTVQDLGAAPLDDVLHAWQGLGYYARARNLHKCAQTITRDHNGRFPESEARLLELPGIGPYTAAAISAIAFGQKATPVDGNIERVMTRLFKIEDPLPGAKKVIRQKAESLTPDQRAGDFAQALMDLGATICTPKKAACALCPWMAGCQARLEGHPTDYPKKLPKKPKPTKYAHIFWLSNSKGQVLMRQRPPKGLLGGLMEFPSTDWIERKLDIRDVPKKAPASTLWHAKEVQIKHTFTHFHLIMTPVSGQVSSQVPVDGIWVHPAQFGDYALPTLMKKVAKVFI